MWQDDQVWVGNASSLWQHVYDSPEGGLATRSVLYVWPGFQVGFSYLYFLTNICPFLHRKHGLCLEHHDSRWDGSFWVLIISDAVYIRSNTLDRYCGSHTHTGLLRSFSFVKITMQALFAQHAQPQHYKWHPFKCLVWHCRGKSTEFSELRGSTVYSLIIKKGQCVSQNMVLWAKAVFLCSLEQPSVALHLKPITLHHFSETDRTCKMSNGTR